MTNFISAQVTPRPIYGNSDSMRAPGYIFFEPWSREAEEPTNWPDLYDVVGTNTEVDGVDTVVNRYFLTTDSSAGGDDVSMRTASLRFERNYTSLVTGMASLLGTQTSSLQIDTPFQTTSAANIEGFVGLHGGVAALTALPTTARHMGVYWDVSAGANYMLTASNGTTQVTVDTTVPVDTAAHILRIFWTGENSATLQLYSAAGVTQGTGQTVAAFNLTTGASHEMHWFVQTETTAAKTMYVYPWRAAWQ